MKKDEEYYTFTDLQESLWESHCEKEFYSIEKNGIEFFFVCNGILNGSIQIYNFDSVEIRKHNIEVIFTCEFSYRNYTGKNVSKYCAIKKAVQFWNNI